MLPNKAQHSPINSSSQENNVRLHFHACPHPQPKWFIPAADNNLFSNNSNKWLSVTIKGTPSTHVSVQKKGFRTITNHSSQVIIKVIHPHPSLCFFLSFFLCCRVIPKTLMPREVFCSILFCINQKNYGYAFTSMNGTQYLEIYNIHTLCTPTNCVKPCGKSWLCFFKGIIN
jgi:hypothetical protein